MNELICESPHENVNLGPEEILQPRDEEHEGRSFNTEDTQKKYGSKASLRIDSGCLEFLNQDRAGDIRPTPPGTNRGLKKEKTNFFEEERLSLDTTSPKAERFYKRLYKEFDKAINLLGFENELLSKSQIIQIMKEVGFITGIQNNLEPISKEDESHLDELFDFINFKEDSLLGQEDLFAILLAIQGHYLPPVPYFGGDVQERNDRRLSIKLNPIKIELMKTRFSELISNRLKSNNRNHSSDSMNREKLHSKKKTTIAKKAKKTNSFLSNDKQKHRYTSNKKSDMKRSFLSPVRNKKKRVGESSRIDSSKMLITNDIRTKKRTNERITNKTTEVDQRSRASYLDISHPVKDRGVNLINLSPKGNFSKSIGKGKHTYKSSSKKVVGDMSDNHQRTKNDNSRSMNRLEIAKKHMSPEQHSNRIPNESIKKVKKGKVKVKDFIIPVDFSDYDEEFDELKSKKLNKMLKLQEKRLRNTLDRKIAANLSRSKITSGFRDSSQASPKNNLNVDLYDESMQRRTRFEEFTTREKIYDIMAMAEESIGSLFYIT